MKIVNIITGLFFIVVDLIKQGFLIIIGAIEVFFIKNKKDNAFISLLTLNCLIIFGLMVFSIFWVVGHFSVILGLLVAFILSFVISDYRYKNYKNYHDGEWEARFDIAGTSLAIGLTIIILIINNINVAYEYDKLGKYTFNDKELFYDKALKDEEGKATGKFKKTPNKYVEMMIKGKEIKVSVNGCEAGEHIIFEETLPIKFIPGTQYLDTNFYAECSKGITKYKEIKE